MSLLPLFPLPNVVLFPDALLPLHIFEPRYRAMVADALESDRRIVMVLLRPGWEGDYEGRPPIYSIGCAAIIVHAARLEDGRYNILLRGLERVRIGAEDQTRSYRRADVEPLLDGLPGEEDQRMLAELRAKLDSVLGLSQRPVSAASTEETSRFSSMADEALIHVLAQGLDLEPVEKQALLERDSVRLRAELLVELVEMRRLLASMPPVRNQPH